MAKAANGPANDVASSAPVEIADQPTSTRAAQLTATLAQPVIPRSSLDLRHRGFLLAISTWVQASGTADAIDTRKAVLLNGRAAGTILIRIGAASQVYVRQSDLAALLAGKLSTPFGGNAEFITLDQIRDHGVNVHYNASKDELLITT